MHFAEPDIVQPGERVFDVLLQGESVLQRFDNVQATGKPRRAIVKEFAGVRVTGELMVDLRTTVASVRPPILCAIEAVREE